MKAWSILVFLSLGAMAAELKPNVVRTLAELPEDTEYFLQVPASFDLDSSGAYYIVDWIAQVIFKWNAEGEFQQVIGKPGGGPGEFVFMGSGGPQGYLGIVEDKLFVYDGGRRAVQMFDNKGEFLGSEGLQMQLGRTNNFFIAKAGSWVIQHGTFTQDPPMLTVSIFNTDTKKHTNVVERVDSSWERKSSGGQTTGVVIKGFSEGLVSAFNRANNQLIVGYTGEPSFSIYDLEGTLIKKVKVNRSRRDVEKKDKDEFNELPWIKNNQFFTTSFPEKMPYYNAITPVGKKHFMVYEMSPFFRNVQGVLIDDSGEVLGRFSFKCGENGSILGANGRVLRVRTDEEGFFNLEELNFSEAS